MAEKVFEDATLYSQKDLVPILHKSAQWFERGRWAGTGPEYIKVGRSVFYKGSALNCWLDSQARSNTGEGA